jgi:adenine specific DNA methylase Mod
MNVNVEKIKKLLIGVNNIDCDTTIKLIMLKKIHYENLDDYIYKNIKCFYNDENEFYNDNILDQLYIFFSKYIDNDGFIIYDKNDLNYLFSDNVIYIDDIKHLRNYKFTIDKYNFYFDVSNVNNINRNDFDINYNYSIQYIDDKKIYINVENDKKNIDNFNQVLSELNNNNIDINNNDLNFMFKSIEKNNSVEIYVCKNVYDYLEKKFSEWIFESFFKNKSLYDEKKLLKINNIIFYGIKLIEYINEFETNLYKIVSNFKKIKYENYVITLDKINDISIINRIINHKNFSYQFQEWKSYEIIDETFNANDIIDNTLWGTELNYAYRFLPIDLKYFDDMRDEILNCIQDIDEKLNGIVINGNNYYGLNLLSNDFHEKIQSIYIDPPFNLDKDFFTRLYKTKYNNFKWVKLLYERILMSKELLKESGSFFMRCDNNGNHIGNMMLNNMLDFRNNIIFKKDVIKSGKYKKFSVENEYLLFYVKNKNKNLFNNIKINKNRELGWTDIFLKRRNRYTHSNFSKSIYVNNKKIVSNEEGHWMISQKEANRLYEEKKLIAIDENLNIISKLSDDEIRKAKIRIAPNMIYKRENEYYHVTNLWTDINGYLNMNNTIISNMIFTTENSEKLLKRVILSSTNEGDFVLDYFLGSGTTAIVAQKLKRRWIGIEKNRHFFDIILPKLKKVLYYSDNLISKDDDVAKIYNKNNAGGMFKYIILDELDIFLF